MNDIFARTAGEIAREAGSLLKHFSETHKLQVENKGSEYDFVTNADRESQRLVEGRLRAAFPGHRFVGEEDGVPDDEIARRIHAAGPDEYLWICDPLDGTINYVHHLGLYAVSLGLVREGKCVAGAIYLPESDELFCGAAGEGATLNGRPIRASSVDSLHLAVTAADIPVTDLPMRQRFLGWMAEVGMNTSNLRVTGSACMSIALTACGRVDAYWNVGVHPWDVAAGIAICEGAGCAVSDIYGDPFRFDMSRGFLVCAPGLKGQFGPYIHQP